jgi:uracil-DNA glycosylase family 4
MYYTYIAERALKIPCPPGVAMTHAFPEFQTALRACRACDLEHEPRPLVWGHAQAPVAIVGQAPSRSGHLTGKPWNDASGKTLRTWLGVDEATFYDPTRFYLTALAHCFPGKAKGGGDRLPPPACWDLWVKQELTYLRPRLWVLVGRQSAHKVLGVKDFTEAVFEDWQFDGVPAWVLPHPSPANRKWFKDHPSFAEERLPRLLAAVTHALRSSP